MEQKSMAAGILSGGQSRRMGRNKSLLTLQGKSFLEKILGECEGFSERIVSVDSMEKYQWLQKAHQDVVLVEDVYREYGPMEGIYQILRVMHGEACLTIANDMPLVSRHFLEKIAGEYEGEDCLVLTVEGRPQPLCAVYHRNCLEALEELRREQIHKPRMLYDRVRTRYLPLETLGYGADVISNINTPEEYQELMKR